MNNQNLIPIASTGKAREWGMKGGLSRSPKKSLAAKLREMRKRGLTDENCARIHDILTDVDANDLDILLLLENMRAKAMSIAENDKVAKLYIELRKLRHGSDANVQINMVDTLKRFYTEVDDKKEIGA